MDLEARRVEARVLRTLGGAEKLATVSNLTALVRSLAWAGLRDRLPNATEAELEAEFFRLLLGAETARKVLAHRREVRSRPAGTPGA